jgi:hypothetical protein
MSLSATTRSEFYTQQGSCEAPLSIGGSPTQLGTATPSLGSSSGSASPTKFPLMPGFAKPLNTSEVSDRDSLRGRYKDSLTYDNLLRFQVKAVITLPNEEVP